MNFFRSACKAHGDDRQPRQERIALPAIERNSREKIIFADHRVRLISRRGLDRIVEPDNCPGIHTERVEKAAEMTTQKRMTSDAQHTHSGSIYRQLPTLFRGRRDLIA